MIDPDGIMERIPEPFFRLTVEDGLSVTEALCFCLVRIIGLSPMDASEALDVMFGREIPNTKVSSYVDRAKRKLKTGELILDSLF